MNIPPESRSRLRRALTISIAAAGPVLAVATLAALDTTSGLSAALHIFAAALALGVGLAAGLRLQRADLLNRSRGRGLAVGAAEPGTGTALRVALATTLLVLVVSATIEIIALQVAATGSDDSSLGSKALQDARDRRDAAAETLAEDQGPTGPEVVGPHSQRGAVPGTGDGAFGDLLSGAEVLRVRPTDTRSRDLLAGRPLHLRGFVVDAYDRSGRLRERDGQSVRLTAPPGGEARAAGQEGNGWIDVRAPGEPPVTGPKVSLDVVFVAPSDGLLFAPSRLTEVLVPRAENGNRAAASVLYDPALETYMVEAAAPDWEQSLHYRTHSTLPTVSLDDLRGVAARKSIAGSVSLPQDRLVPGRAQALNSLRSYAATLTQGFDNDADRVLSIVRHLREQFSYEIYDTSFLSPEEAQGFIERGAGSCTHFASLATLLLRLEGLPTRLAAGYVAREMDPRTGEWIVRERDGHAWVEVHFERYGWLLFDPTPGDPEVGGVSRGWTPLEDESRVDSELRQRAAPRTSPVGRVLGGILGWTVKSVGRLLSGADGPVSLLILAVAGLLALGWRVKRRRRQLDDPSVDAKDGDRSSARPRKPSGGATELLAAVRKRGWTQGRTTTPTAFARRLESTHPEARGMGQAMGLILRTACTGDDLAADEERHLHDVGDRIGARSDGSSGS